MKLCVFELMRLYFIGCVKLIEAVIHNYIAVNVKMIYNYALNVNANDVNAKFN